MDFAELLQSLFAIVGGVGVGASLVKQQLGDFSQLRVIVDNQDFFVFQRYTPIEL